MMILQKVRGNKKFGNQLNPVFFFPLAGPTIFSAATNSDNFKLLLLIHFNKLFNPIFEGFFNMGHPALPPRYNMGLLNDNRSNPCTG